MAITARFQNRSSGIFDLEQVLIHFISENDRSASALVIGMVQAVTRRRWMFNLGKHLHRQHQVLVKGCLEAPYLLTARVFSIYDLRTSFPRDLGHGMSSCSQGSMPCTSSSSCSALFTIIDGTRQSRWRAWRSSSKIDLALG